MTEQNSPAAGKEDPKPKSGAPGQLQIELDEATAQGAYVNFMIVGHTDAEFTMDFIYVQPHQPKGKVRFRVITAPSHAKRMLSALDENIRKYEASFGPVKASDVPEKKIGFSQT
jgi:Protein of unknown function (DUF3467)